MYTLMLNFNLVPYLFIDSTVRGDCHSNISNDVSEGTMSPQLEVYTVYTIIPLEIAPPLQLHM